MCKFSSGVVFQIGSKRISQKRNERYQHYIDKAVFGNYFAAGIELWTRQVELAWTDSGFELGVDGQVGDLVSSDRSE